MSSILTAADTVLLARDSMAITAAQPGVEGVAKGASEVVAIALNSNIDLGNVVLYAIMALVLVVCSAMASGSEVAFFSLTHSDIDELESKNTVTSRRVLELLSNPDRLLATILVTNNMVNICLVIMATLLVNEIFTFDGIWQFVFNNVLLTYTMQFFEYNKSLLSSSGTAFIAIIVVYIWQYAGYIMLIYINGLTAVPKDVLEASAIDGANAWVTLMKIKLPMIASTITICTFLTLTSAFKQFDVNMALTNGTGSIPDFFGNYLTNGTQMLALNIYNTAISKNNYALAQAKAVLFFLILASVSLIQVRISNSKEVEL